jgi:predicted negative regulator of RcsB-dependent stress response
MSNEALKKNFIDRATIFVKKNLKAIFVYFFILLIILFTFFFYDNLQKKKNIKISEQYAQASILIKQKKISESKILLDLIINKDHQFYSPLALYLMIDNNIENDEKKIIIFFDKILKNNSIDKENLNLIRIKKAIYLINIDNEELIVSTLNPIINSSSAWKNMAIDIISQYFISKNQNLKAGEYLQLLKNKKNK